MVTPPGNVNRVFIFRRFLLFMGYFPACQV